MKFLAALILAMIFVIYGAFLKFLMGIVPSWLSPLVLVFGLALAIHILTEKAKGR